MAELMKRESSMADMAFLLLAWAFFLDVRGVSDRHRISSSNIIVSATRLPLFFLSFSRIPSPTWSNNEPPSSGLPVTAPVSGLWPLNGSLFHHFPIGLSHCVGC